MQTIIIESIPMIDRLKRAHLALMSICIDEQKKESPSSERWNELEEEVKACEHIINCCTEILNDYETN